MEEIEIFETAIATQCNNLTAAGINPTIFWAYRACRRNGNEQIDFADVIWDEDIEEIAGFFADHGITEFTISSNFSGLIKTLVEFEKQGFEMVGTTEVNANYTDWQSGKFVKIPALQMRKA